MTPVERLHAAIDKLERLKLDGTPGPWRVWTDKFSGDFEVRAPDGLVAPLWVFGPAVRPHANAPLIVTLHRTIDAQLTILRHDVDMHDLVPEEAWLRSMERSGDLDLADAILGGDS